VPLPNSSDASPWRGLPGRWRRGHSRQWPSANGKLTDGSDVAAEVNEALAALARLSRYERRAASRWAKLLKGLD